MADGNSPRDGDFLDALNLENVDGLENAQTESGALPKKVELDIDDLYLEEDEEEEAAAPAKEEGPPKEEARVEAEAPPKEEAPAKKKRSPLVVSLALAVPLLLAATGALVLLLPEKEVAPPPVEQVELGPGQIQLAPFLINYPSGKKDSLIKLNVVVNFTKPQTEESLPPKVVVIRDLIYRYVQSLDPAVFSEQGAQDKLSAELTAIMNSQPDTGGVKEVVVLQLEAV